VAALLVGSPTSEVPGLVPAARLIAVDPFADSGGNDVTDAYEIAVAIERLVARGVDLINLSLAGPPNRLLEQTVREAERRDVVLVAAAGNGGPGAPPAYPAAYAQVVAVTAIDGRLQPYRRAQRGEFVELAAPGVDVPTAASMRGVRPETGTSFSTPFVTAAALALRAADRDLATAGFRRRLHDVACRASTSVAAAGNQDGRC
jgi:subtilisin family serine protease